MEILIAAVAGSVANLLLGGRPRKNRSAVLVLLANTVLGALGAGLSWWVMALLTGEKPDAALDLRDLLAAIAGAVVLLLLGRAIHGRRVGRRDQVNARS